MALVAEGVNTDIIVHTDAGTNPIDGGKFRYNDRSFYRGQA